MHLLMLTPSLPYPPHQGGALRNYGILRGLHAAGHRITLLSFGDPSADQTALRSYCEDIVIVAPPDRSKLQRLKDLIGTAQPDLIQRLNSSQFAETLRTLLQETAFDLIQFEGLEMAVYLPLVRQIQPEAKLCYDAHNAEYELQQVIFEVDRQQIRRWPVALYSYIQARRIERAEAAVCAAVDCVLAVSDEDATALRNFRADKTVAVIPNGIFAEKYDNNHEEFDLGSAALTFTGKMDYRPNVDAVLWFAADILPLIQNTVPDACFYVVGQQPHPNLQKLRGQHHVVLTGWVPEVQPYLTATAVYVAPLRMGSGTRLKILEAMASGSAVVATTRAAAGLPDEVRQTLILADTADTMAEAIVDLLNAPQKRDSLGAAARQAVAAHYDWRVIIPDLLDTYKALGLG